MSIQKHTMTIDGLIKKSYACAEEKGWHNIGATFVERLCLLHSEISEALEDYRSGRKPGEIYYEGTKPCGVPIELADLVIRVADLSAVHVIDLEEALWIKQTYNLTRPPLHGGKKI